MGALRPAVLCTALLLLVIPAELQEGIQYRHYRPRPDNDKCDRGGRCSDKNDGHIEEADQEDFKAEKERPAVLTRDDYPTAVGVGRPGIGSDYKPKPGRDDEYDPRPVDHEYKPKPFQRDREPKPVRDREVYEPKPVRDREVYEPKPVRDREVYEPKPEVPRPVREGYGGGGRYLPKDDGYDRIPRPVRRGGYKPAEEDYRHGDDDKDEKDDYPRRRPVNGGGYISVEDKDDYSRRPGRGGGYNPKPARDEDDYIPRPVGGGYNPKPVNDKDDYPPRPVGGYDDSNNKPDKDHGGYDDGKKDHEGGRPANDKCICVPYYQCKDGHIVTDGAGIIDARKRPVPGEDLPLDGKFSAPSCGPFHVCCSTPESSTVKPFEHRCGRRNPTGINSRILSPSNKGEADFGEWPWQVYRNRINFLRL